VTESSAKLLCAAFGAACLACLSGCGHTSGTAAPSTHSDPAEPVPGIAATQPTQIPPDAAACTPTPADNGVATTATVSDPTAPRITINVPSGWSSAAGTGDTALTLSGPDRITHIWTNTKNYLVAIHLEGRSGTRGWSATKSALTQDFAVVIP
jgi:hypothetical protein